MGNVFNNKDLHKALKDGSEDVTLCNLNLSGYPNNESTVLLMYIISWITDNTDNDVYVFATSNLYNREKEMPTVLGFISKDDKNDFFSWYNGFKVEFDSWDSYTRSRMWPDRKVLDKKLEYGEPFKIEATINYSLSNFDRSGKIDEKTFELFHWMNTKCQDTVYRYNGMFAFSNASDASLFKLTWVDDTKKSITGEDELDIF